MHESTLAEYTFLPWLRQGIGAEIPNVDGGAPPDGERATVTVRFDINGEAVVKAVELIGPGDIIGINPRAIVKTEPRNWITDFEPNYLPYIEFYEEDFPWRYTPASAAGSFDRSRLRPWLFLVVLSEDEFEEIKHSGPLPAIKILKQAADIFPKPEQIWAWAHVHVSKNMLEGNTTPAGAAAATAAVDRLETILAENPDNASSRLICPRKLNKNTAYHAFLIPSFELGRLAGLGQTTDTPNAYQAAWGAENQTEFPIYYRWYFRTGERGDFEYLVELLEPRPVDKKVGVRDMDMQAPGYEVDGLTGLLSVIGLEGALKSPETVSSPELWPPTPADFDNPQSGSAERFLLQLEEKVNLQFALQQQESDDNPHPDPIISPPLYGKWHAKAEKLAIQEPGWVNELNKDPRNRAAAGSGTRVIQQNQEKYMQQAWRQLGDVLQVNQKIRQLQLSLVASAQIAKKHIEPMTQTQLLAFTAPLHYKILGSPTTIGKQLEESRIPVAAVDVSVRKFVRPRGPLMKKTWLADSPKPLMMIASLNDGKLSAAPPPPPIKTNLNLDLLTGKIASENLPAWIQKLAVDKRTRWMLGALILLSLLLTPLLSSTAAILPAAGLGVALIALERLRIRSAAASTLKEAGWQPAAIDQIPARPNFSVAAFGAPLPAVGGTPGNDSIAAARFRVALKDLHTVVQSDPPKPPEKPVFDLENAGKKIRTAIDPVVSITNRSKYLVHIDLSISDAYLKPRKTIAPVMAHPVFPDPMYRPLRDISAEFLVPNLHLITNNTVSLMEVNERFIESYMVGLNHEMGRELLWREYPTDQRGSYFRQFWDVGDRVNRDTGKSDKAIEEEKLDIKALHTWEAETELGAHGNLPAIPGAEPGEERLVLVVRGDLLKKYPTAVIFAQKAKWSTDENGNDIRLLDDSNPGSNLQSPLFKAEIEPDIKFLGFNLTISMVKGSKNPADNNPGWFFVIQERPGEPRFGMDDKGDDTPEIIANWNQLAWEHLADFENLNCIDLDKEIAPTALEAPDNLLSWGRNAADMAYILYQVPVMVAFHAADMLKLNTPTT